VWRIDGHRDCPAGSRSVDPARSVSKASEIEGQREERGRRSEAEGIGRQEENGCVMVLVDTSIWIRFLANRNPYAAELDRLLDRDEAAGHDLIYGELLIGDPGGREPLLSSYQLMHGLSPVGHAEVVAFVRARELHGRGIGWIDAHLLASALVADVRLWTADERLANVASELGIGYIPSMA